MAVSSFLAASASAAVLLAAAGVDRPPLMPAHDATVTYRVAPGGKPPQVIHVYFGDAGRKLRIDGPSGQGGTIVDRASGLLTVVMNAQHAFMEVPARGIVRDPFLLGDDMDFVRAGTTQVIAGLGCADWRMTSPKGASTACVTPDGLLLSASGADSSGGQGRIVALAVSQAALGPDVFSAPPGFTRVSHPVGPVAR